MTTSILLEQPKPRAQADAAEGFRVTVYTRVQCCCCHTALDVIRAFQTKHGFPIEEIDVDSDPALAAEFGSSVPVVAVSGRVCFRGVVNRVLFARLVEAAVQERNRSVEGG